ncbi:MAG: MFS transporter [Actinomycetota bacterium]|nr:MFS transporter [Actinomycetota bacterium]
MVQSQDDSGLEQAEDALVDGDVAYQRGTAQAALRHRNFRIVYLGTFSSNIGTWMQNVVLGAYALKLSGSTEYLGVIFFCQLGPLLFLSPVGGLLADIVDRRRLLVAAQFVQMALSFGLAALALTDDPSLVTLAVVVTAIGIANAIGAPGLSAILPTLVPREDLQGAVALQSVQMNLSRVIGPAIGGVLYAAFDAAPVFAFNAATYGFAIVGLVWATYPRHANAVLEERGFRRLLSGARIVNRDPLLKHLLITLFTFSLFSLTFVGLFPEIAAANLDVELKSVEYGFLYACFGFGAALGAITVGTVFAKRSKARLLRPGFIAFAVLLTAFALLRSVLPAYPVAAVLGYAYFIVITSLSTVLQEHLEESQRGRVMALWIMGFGGTVPLGVLLGGWLTEHFFSITALVIGGAVWALVLATWSNPEQLVSKGAVDG